MPESQGPAFTVATYLSSQPQPCQGPWHSQDISVLCSKLSNHLLFIPFVFNDNPESHKITKAYLNLAKPLLNTVGVWLCWIRDAILIFNASDDLLWKPSPPNSTHFYLMIFSQEAIFRFICSLLVTLMSCLDIRNKVWDCMALNDPGFFSWLNHHLNSRCIMFLK